MATVYPVEAYSYASRFVLRDVRAFFSDGHASRSTKTQLIIEWAPESVAYAYDFGALVFVNVPDPVREAVLARFAAHIPREPHPPLHEDFLIEVRPGAAIGIEVAFDRVVVPDLGPATLSVIAYVLAQSTAIDYYDEDVQAILDRIGTIATEVSKHGKPRGRQRDLVRFVGAAINSQVEIISAISLLDKPDITWEDEGADRLHDKLRYHLEIAERYKALEAKLQVIREALQALLELSSERRMLFVEVAILLLIVLETAVGLLKLH
jgi:required for meiotic nuclear division protein 1